LLEGKRSGFIKSVSEKIRGKRTKLYRPGEEGGEGPEYKEICEREGAGGNKKMGRDTWQGWELF